MNPESAAPSLPPRRNREWLGSVVKFVVVVVLLGALIYPQANRDNFWKIWEQPKHWGLMSLAALLATAVVTLSYVRWWVLIRALHVPCSLGLAVRLGFLSNLFSLVGMGLLGGDVFKAYVLAKGHTARRAEVIASVLADRFLGLMGLLFGVSAIAIIGDLAHAPSRAIRISVYAAWAASVGSLLLLALVPLPIFNSRYNDEQLAKLPGPVRTFILLFRAVRLYRHQPGAVILVIVWGAITHSLLGVVMLLVAAGLGGPTPSILSQLVVVPLANFSSVLPIPGGLGAFEMAVGYLFEQIPHDPPLTKGQGLLCALGYRAVLVFVALIGVGLYLTEKRDVDAAMKAAEQERVEREKLDRERLEREQAPTA